MLIYFYKYGDEYYIFHAREHKIEILEDILGNSDIVNELTIGENKIYKRSDLSEVIDEELFTEIFNSFKSWAYSIIKKQIYSTVLVNTCFAKYQYTNYLYNRIAQDGEVIKTPDELYTSIINEEMSLGEQGEQFKYYYEMSQNIDINVISALKSFDDTFFNDESTVSDIFSAIFLVNDLYKSDAYTFLKERIYS